MSSVSLVPLFLALLLLALVPGTGVLVVSSRAATSGFKQGAFAALGILVADLLYILFALSGLLVIAWLSDTLLLFFRVLFAFLLFRAGLRKLREADRPPPQISLPVTQKSAASFAMGFVLTLINAKTAVFYFGFLQAFVAVGELGLDGVFKVLGVALLALTLVRLGYVVAAAREVWIGPRLGRALVRAGGVLMIGVGIYLAVSAFTGPLR